MIKTAVIRVEKTKDYTVMSNYHLRDKNLSLASKGLMSLMLSLPDDWDYTVRGLVAYTGEGVSKISTIIKNLESNGYIVRHQDRDNKGNFKHIEYIVKENPLDDRNTVLPCTENPYTDNPCTENQPQLNTIYNQVLNKPNTKDIIPSAKNEQKHRYGEYQNVLLTDNELDKLKYEFPDWEERIERLSEYIASKGTKYKSHLATIRSWARKDGIKVNDSVEQDKRKKADDRARAEAQAWLESTKGTK